MKAIILAGGFGTRLKSVTGEDTPKPMVSILGKPFLEHQILFLKNHGINEIILAVHHHANKIKTYFGDGRLWLLNMTYAEEEFPLGTGGAVKNSEKYIDDTFIVMNGDSYSDVDLRKMIEFHKTEKNMATMCLIDSKNNEHYGSVSLNGNIIHSFSEKTHENTSTVNAGVYIFEPQIFSQIEPNKKISLETDIFPKLAQERLLSGFKHDGYFMDIGRPETYDQFKKDVFKTVFMTKNRSMRDALSKIDRTKINLILVVDENERLLGVVNERLVKEHILRGGDVNDSLEVGMISNPIVAKSDDSEARINEILTSGINRLPILDESGRVVEIRFRDELPKTEKYPVIRGRAPLRISFAGGGTDMPDFFEKYGGAVINTTINKYCYATVVKRADKRIIINSDLGDEVVLNLGELEYNGKFNLVKAIINVMNPDFGFEIYLHSDIPPGRGLGSSATAAVLIASLLSRLQNVKYDDYSIAKLAHKAEVEELGIKGGWQDQYAAITGGFSFMEFSKDKNIIYPLRLKSDVIDELNHHMLLCYVGKSHFSETQQHSLQGNIQKSDEEVMKGLNDLKDVTQEIKNSLLTNEIGKIGKLLHDSWENKKKLSSKISDPKIDHLYEVGLKNGSTGGKLLGSGGGGYILFFHNPNRRNELKKSLELAGGEVMDFKFEFDGTKIWSPDSRI